MLNRSSTTLEKELKYSLVENEYEKLRSFFKKKRKNIFLNYYFDTNKFFLFSKKVGLRLRIKNNKNALITLKTPNPKSYGDLKALNVRNEIENKVPMDIFKDIIQSRKNILKYHSLKPVVFIKTLFPNLVELKTFGPLYVERITIEATKSIKLELDKCKYGQRIFYELESETSKPKRSDVYIRHLFNRLYIKYRPTKITKLQKLLKLIQK